MDPTLFILGIIANDICGRDKQFALHSSYDCTEDCNHQLEETHRSNKKTLNTKVKRVQTMEYFTYLHAASKCASN